ncbi:hypothetical protein MRB53_010316 [Persea americana]|uniref:Uncharacterized protein n=1 Tax=Persea americana TaxID=3435 RepID=A0ACC2LRM4_PERAE|nr:hypothetical protein MRB53_010316 [Persea americana]
MGCLVAVRHYPSSVSSASSSSQHNGTNPNQRWATSSYASPAISPTAALRGQLVSENSQSWKGNTGWQDLS